MFGDTKIVESTTLKIDEKGRITLPSFTSAEPGDKIALMYDLKRTKILIYEWQKFKEKLDRLYEELEIMYREKEINYKQHHTLVSYIYGDGCLEPPTDVGKGRRIVIPKRAIEKLNLKDEVFVIGQTVSITTRKKVVEDDVTKYIKETVEENRLELYPSEESYTLSKKNV